MRIHLVAGILAGSFASVAPIGQLERALVLLCTALVISAEAANTALEALVDLRGGPPSELARLAKDAAAGAVLVMAVASVAVFAGVLAGSWRQIVVSWQELAVPAAAGVGIAVTATLSLIWRGGLEWGAPALALVGVIAVTLLGVSAACPPCALVPAGLLAIAATAGARRRATCRE
jgi:diacylglycerol kinase